MIQLIIPSFEQIVGYNWGKEFIFDPMEEVENFEIRGYSFLTDVQKGSLDEKFRETDLAKKFKYFPYIPERVQTPTGKIFDEKEIIEGLKTTPMDSGDRKELVESYYYFNAIHHEEIDEGRYRFEAPIFSRLGKVEDTLQKYKDNPFYSWD
ncbi:hypothetical protein HOD29_03740 [archaeon]|jgi:hypothetical protein|nr:hypothetical protein [archaeon]